MKNPFMLAAAIPLMAAAYVEYGRDNWILGAAYFCIGTANFLFAFV